MTAFPTYCLRGLRSKGFLLEGTLAISGSAFEPDYRTGEGRNDGGFEVSINWEDDESVLNFTLRNHQIAAYGAARVPCQVFDQANMLPNLRPAIVDFNGSSLLYERAQLSDNPFHGNIVYARVLPKPLIRMIANYLAMHAEYLHL